MRLSISFFLAIVINILLFVVMYRMITGNKIDLTETNNAQIIDFIQPSEPQGLNQSRPLRKAPPEPPKLPERQVTPSQMTPTIVNEPIKKILPRLEMDLSLGKIKFDQPFVEPVTQDISLNKGPSFVLPHDLVAIVRNQPRYPRSLKRRRVEGYVVVEFIVNKEGKVRDAKIVESKPSGAFDQSVLRALRSWKFRPKITDGVAVAVRTKQRVEFNLKK